jgi:hypothetical protein
MTSLAGHISENPVFLSLLKVFEGNAASSARRSPHPGRTAIIA